MEKRGRKDKRTKKAKRRGRKRGANREMRFRGLGTEREGERQERIPTGITSVHAFMSALSLSEAFGKIAYLLPIRIS